MMNDAITVYNLTKKYENFTLDKVSFRIPMGSIMGFVGENGAGKTTTIKAILDLISIDDGTISILGSDHRDLSKDTKSLIGTIFDGNHFPENMNLNEINLVMKRIYPNWSEKVFHSYMDKFQIPNKKIIKEFSRGMKMKLSIGVALSHQAKLLILDEATSGLDPMVRDEILDIFLEFIQDEDHTILLSSHIISDIEKIADYVTFINKGKIVFSENKDDLIYRHGIIHCKNTDIDLIDKKFIVGVQNNKFGSKVLIKNKDMFARSYHNYEIEKASIEEIMLFINKKGREY